MAEVVWVWPPRRFAYSRQTESSGLCCPWFRVALTPHHKQRGAPASRVRATSCFLHSLFLPLSLSPLLLHIPFPPSSGSDKGRGDVACGHRESCPVQAVPFRLARPAVPARERKGGAAHEHSGRGINSARRVQCMRFVLKNDWGTTLHWAAGLRTRLLSVCTHSLSWSRTWGWHFLRDRSK